MLDDQGRFWRQRQWQAAADAAKKRSVQQHPLWSQWCLYQGRTAATFMHELRELAVTTAGRPAPIGANAGRLWPWCCRIVPS